MADSKQLIKCDFSAVPLSQINALRNLGYTFLHHKTKPLFFFQVILFLTRGSGKRDKIDSAQYRKAKTKFFLHLRIYTGHSLLPEVFQNH